MAQQKKRKLKPQVKTFLTIFLVIALCSAVYLGFWGYKQYAYRFSEAVLKEGSIKVFPGTSTDAVATELQGQGLIESKADYLAYAEQFERDSVRVGYYKFNGGESYRTLLTRLHFGQENGVRVTFHNIRTLDRLAGAVSRNLMVDSVTLYNYLKGDAQNSGDAKNYIAHFIPNTYELYWNSSPEEIIERMRSEYDKFWESDNRKAKALKLGFTPDEISTIASIVIEETKVEREMSTVAGVYINRLGRGIPLQADPTVKFAMGDFGIKRILNKHLEYQSPYNTYIHAGLPPGPICIPPISALDATLNYVDKKHNYIYFCANPDFSGTHVFSTNLSEHNRNAAAYHRELNRRRIR